MQQAAVCIIENSKKEILLLRRIFSPEGWCLPGGRIDIQKESITEGLVREILEETGIELTSYSLLGESKAVDGTTVHVFYATTKVTTPKLSKEHSNYLWMYTILPEIPLAGNTLEFLKLHTMDHTLHGLEEIMPFGKYKEKLTVQGILEINPEYILWLNDQTQFKLQHKIIKKAQSIIDKKRQAIRDYENEIAMEESDRIHKAQRLRDAVDTPYGKAINEHDGDHSIIDEYGNYTGEVVHNYWGQWSKGSWANDI